MGIKLLKVEYQMIRITFEAVSYVLYFHLTDSFSSEAGRVG